MSGHAPFSRVRKGRPAKGAPAARQKVVDAVGMANLEHIDLHRIRNDADADRAIARFRRMQEEPEWCDTNSGGKRHIRRGIRGTSDGHMTLCGFRAGGEAPTHLEVCAMCESIYAKEKRNG